MVDCEECGKRLGILEGYQHPTLGKKHLLCGSCFDQVEKSVARWREFILAHSDDITISRNNSSLDWKKIFTSFPKKQKFFNNSWVEKEIHLRR